MSEFKLGDSRVSLAELATASQSGIRISLSDPAREKILAARAVVERYAEGDEPIYGLNTGLGGNVGFRLSKAEIEAFQVKMIRGRCIGVGEPFPEAIARTMFLCRAIGFAQGGSGISLPVVELTIAMLNAGLTPVIPGRGSLGAGDLGLSAHIGAALIGEGEIFMGGRRERASDALAAAGLTPVTLAPKDGLSILNSSAITCGHATSVLAELSALLQLSVVTACLADEGYAANPHIFDARTAKARPARGQERAAALFRAVLKGSYLYDPGAARSIQDALSFRVLSQIYGSSLTAFETAVDSVETEINAASDNPLVLSDDALMLSTANFHTPAIALAFDTMAIANTHLATASAYRTIKMMNAQLSGLPKYLTPIGGASNGYNSIQKTVSYLHAEVRLKATPASLDALPVSEGVEDHAPQTPLTIRKLEEQLVPLRLLVAIEALVAAQAVDIRKVPRLASVTRILYEAIRSHIPMLIEDRAIGPEVDKVCAMLNSESLLQALTNATEMHGDRPFGLG